MVRDAADKEIATIAYNQVTGNGWLTIRVTDGPVYRADVLNNWAWFRVVTLRTEAGGGAAPLCTYSRSFRETYYAVGGVREFCVDLRKYFGSRKVFTIRKCGQAVGNIRPLDMIMPSGVVMVMPQDVPLPIRLFMLAMEYQK